MANSARLGDREARTGHEHPCMLLFKVDHAFLRNRVKFGRRLCSVQA